MIHHHPDDDLLLALAAGRLDSGPALLVSVHLESCPDCRARLHTLQAIGGAMLESAEPQLLLPESLARTLERIDAPSRAQSRKPAATSWPAPALPDGAPWPRALAGSEISPWRWMAPGMHFSRVRLPHDPQASLYLLQIAPGKSLARHTHTQLELTQVLCGAFDDGRSTFAAGDFDEADPQVHHQPVVSPGGVCVCLAYVAGRLKFDGAITAMIGRLIGM
jgi:putative transcriptional regulator